ncbi:phosphatase PAP2 family protein [Frankia sp. Cj3]
MALLGLGVLSWKLAGTSGPTWFDASVQSRLAHRFAHDQNLFRIIACLGAPVSVLVASVSLALLCGAIRAGRAALLCFFGPHLAGALAEWLLKPLVGRRFDGDLAFPSGHTTGAVSVAVLLAVLFLPTSALGFRIVWPARAAFLLIAITYGAGVGIALVILQAHYATDILGGIAVAVAVILTLARLLDFRAPRAKARSSGLRSWAGYGSPGGSLGRRPALLGRHRSRPGPVQQGTAEPGEHSPAVYP